MSSLSDDSVASTLPRRTETLLERPRTATASDASAPAFLAASTNAATRSTSLEASTLLFMGFSWQSETAAAGLRMPLRAPSIVPVRLVQWVRAKVAWRRPSGRCLHQRPFNTGRWHGSGVTGDLFGNSAAARRRRDLGPAVQTHRSRHHSRLPRRRYRHRPGSTADHRRRSDPARCGAWHRLPAVHHRPRAQAVAPVGPAARDLWARPGAGRGHRRAACRPGASAGRAGLAGCNDRWFRPGAVIDGFRHADPRTGGNDQHQARPNGVLDPAVPGSRHRAAAGAGAAVGARLGGSTAARAARVRDRHRRHRRVADRRALSHQPAVPHHRQYRRQGGDDRRGAACGDRVGNADAAGRAVDGDGRLRRRRHARRIFVPARAGGGHRAVPRHPARPVLHGGRPVAADCAWSSTTGRRS